MSDLPKIIQEKLETSLKDRLGNDFYQKIYLNFGQIVDINRLKFVENTASWKWEPSSYYLCFAFKALEKGIGFYASHITLDSLGNITNSMTFPDIKQFPEKGNLISKNEVVKIVKREKVFTKNIILDLYYDDENDSFVWQIKTWKQVKKQRKTIGNLKIEAHSGKVYDKWSSKESTSKKTSNHIQ